MSASTTKLLVLLLFTGTLVSAGGILGWKRKNNKEEMKDLQEMNRFKSFEEVDSATEEHVQSKEEFFDAHGDDSVQEGLQRNNAAVNIQRFANGKQARNQVKKLEKKNEEAKQQVAATANKWRGFSKGRQEKVKAAKKIQHFYRESKDVDDADLKNLADNTTKEIFNNLDLEDHEEDHGLDAEDHEDSENKKKAVEEMSRFKSFEEVHVHSATEKDVQSKEEFFDAHGDDSVQEVEEKSNYSTPQKTGSTQKKKNKSNSRKHVFRKSNYSTPQKTGSTQKKKNKSNSKKHVSNPKNKNGSQKNSFIPKKTQRKKIF